MLREIVVWNVPDVGKATTGQQPHQILETVGIQYADVDALSGGEYVIFVGLSIGKCV